MSEPTTGASPSPHVPMPPLHDLIPLSHVCVPLKAHNKKTALSMIAERAAAALGGKVDARALFEALLQRERLGSTGMGGGVAIPHARVAGITQAYGFFIRLEKPITFEAMDDQPVDIIFLLLAPEDAGSDHLKALARVARFVRSTAHVALLRAAKDQSAAFAVLSQPEAAIAA